MSFPIVSTLVLVIEILIIVAIGFGSYYGRLLDIDLHHRLIYPAILVQFLIVVLWMIPNSSFLRQDPESPLGSIGKVILYLHIASGLLAILLSVYLALYFLIYQRKWEIGNLPLQRKIMITTMYAWFSAFIFGVLVYLGILLGF